MLNYTNLRTPGVYIDEIPKFPPSIAAVDTAIPAFIGYTKETVFNGKSYLLKPTRIDALVDFEELFGGGPKLNVASIDLDANNAVKKVDVQSTYYLYDSLRIYFANGGGKCYIISIGKYPDPFSSANFISGVEAALEELRKEDEPTLIVFPDGIKLGSTNTDLGTLQKKALALCFDLKDRFLVADVVIANPLDDKYRPTDITHFRTSIGMGNLRYGAAYYPYLKVNLPRQVRYRDVQGKVKKLGLTVNWTTATYIADADTLAKFNELNNIVDSYTSIEAAMQAFLGTHASLEELFQTAKNAFFDAIAGLPDFTNITPVKTAYQAIWELLYQIVDAFLDEFVRTTGVAKLSGTLLTELRVQLQSELAAPSNYLAKLFKVDRLSQEATTVNAPPLPIIHNQGGRAWNFPDLNTAITGVMAGPADPTGLTLTDASAASDAGREAAVHNMIEIVTKRADDVFYSLYTAVTNIYRDAINKELASETEVLRRIPVLANVINFLKSESFLLPPSGGVAGLYARVDAGKGVWKAPANESLINVVAPSVKLDEKNNDELNVDVNFGKSINVIRAFTGKGTLVWGARTLAGNDNEWRYVSVRRFFNMVEESCKKATEQFVFESNDAGTWVKVQAMIENFLTTLWRQGALQGAITDHAFYVAVGLGKTMTALDILEGRMIVEIGIAVVRPAEFIILRFSHKLPES